MKLGRQEIVLLLLTAVAVRLWTARPPAEVSLPPLVAGSGEASLPDAPVVDVGTLRAVSVSDAFLDRDLFTYAPRHLPAAASPPRNPAVVVPVPLPLPVAGPSPVSVRAGPPPLAARYLGSMGPRGARLAFFDHDRQIVMAAEGEPFLRDFKVVKIGYETVTIGFTSPQFKDQIQEIPMSRTR